LSVQTRCPRDVARARQVLAEAGIPRPSFTLLVANSAVGVQVDELIRAMAAETGFVIHVQALGTGALNAQTDRGDYEAAIALWSGRAGRTRMRISASGCNASASSIGAATSNRASIRRSPRRGPAPAQPRVRRCVAGPARFTAPTAHSRPATTPSCSGRWRTA
jgi:hypothetical protein